MIYYLFWSLVRPPFYFNCLWYSNHILFLSKRKSRHMFQVITLFHLLDWNQLSFFFLLTFWLLRFTSINVQMDKISQKITQLKNRTLSMLESNTKVKSSKGESKGVTSCFQKSSLDHLIVFMSSLYKIIIYDLF